MADLARHVLLDWDPPPALVQVTIEAVALLLVHVGFLQPDDIGDLAAMMDRLGEPEQPWARVIRAVFVGAGAPPTDRAAAALTLVDDPDPATSVMAWQWAAVGGGGRSGSRRAR